MQINGLDSTFWKNRRVFITGHTGFIGSWLSLWLSDLGAEVGGYALSPTTQPNMFDVLDLENRMCSIIGDVRKLPQLSAALNEFAPEIVFHLAAQPIVSKGYSAPVETFSTNVMGTVNLLQAIRSAPSIRSALIVTTDKVYENQEWDRGYRKNDALGGHEPYGASKACTELAVNAFRHSYFSDDDPISIATIRTGNIIGGDTPLATCSRTVAWLYAIGAKPQRRSRIFWRTVEFGPSEKDSAPVSVVANEMSTLWGDRTVARQSRAVLLHAARQCGINEPDHFRCSRQCCVLDSR